MQINENTFVDIIAIIDGNEVSGFLGVEDLVDLQIVETAGTSLPIIYAAFFTTRDDVANCFMRTNEIRVRLGNTESTADTFRVFVHTNRPPNKGAQGARKLIEFGGFLLNRD